ncbi:MAG: hypothetical protein ACR2OO_12395 [Thermomicrobiales bacterium]
MKRRSLIQAAVLAPALALPLGWEPLASAAQIDDGTVVRAPLPADERMACAVLPANRILSYYGFPGNELMGILGEFDQKTVLAKLRRQAAAYEAADPSRPFKLAFEVIASVAQRDPQADGSYLAYTGADIVQRYIDFTKANDLLLILDVQFGRRSIQQELEAMSPYLEAEHVHIAIDPEFHVKEGEVPGENLGTIDAADVLYAQQTLADFAAQRGLAPKILVVHQFNYYSISNKDQIAPVDGVQFVLEVDGWGPPNEKRDTYGVIAAPPPIEFYGFKLWYGQDDPLMTEAEVLALSPSPDIVIYQ